MRITTIFFLFNLILLESSNAQCWELVWSDEFNGGALNTTDWNYNTGGTGWGNNELQAYTSLGTNVEVSNGTLKIIAREESYNGADYTSGRITTKLKQEWTFGRIEARMQLPIGQGIWPAFWMLPSENIYGTWPSGGEIDIMEMLGHQPAKTYATLHTLGNNGNNASTSANYTLPNGDFNDGFHDFALEWDATTIKWYVDNVLISTKTPADLAPFFWPFDQDFHLLLNIAVGGNWPGSPDASTVFPQTMEVDYVRVYQQIADVQIEGFDLVEPNSTNILYTVPNITGATYNWSVPAGATLLSGAGTNSILINWGATSGTVSVDVNTVCGNAIINLPVTVSSNLWANFGFENNFSLWDTREHSGAEADFDISTTNVQEGAQAACVTVNTLGPNFWDVQLSRTNVFLDGGETYTIAFYARADQNDRQISIAFINAINFQYLAGTSFTLTDSWAYYSFSFTPSSNVQALFNVDMGYETGEFCFDNFDFFRESILATNLQNFSVSKIENRQLNLMWKINNLKEGQRLSIEKSVDGISFYEVYTTTYLAESYGEQGEWLDLNPENGINYYRLIVREYSAAVLQSEIISASINAATLLEIFPNPVAQNLLVQQNFGTQISYQIMNSQGKCLIKGMLNSYENNLDVSGLPAGIYFINIFENGYGISKRFIRL